MMILKKMNNKKRSKKEKSKKTKYKKANKVRLKAKEEPFKDD